MIKEFKIFEEQLKLFNDQDMFSLGHNENFLYHVTNIRNLNSIKKYGILPDFGETVRKFYSDYYDFDEPETDEEDNERIPIYKDIKGVSFFGDTPLLGFCSPGIGLSNVKWENMVLCIIEKNDTIYHKTDDDEVTDSDGDLISSYREVNLNYTPLFIETGDWFSFEEQTPKYILYGEELKKFVKINFPEKLKTYNLNENYKTDNQKWYHFSDVNYVKLKPQPSHSDPSGIYMFPDYSLDEIKGYWKKKPYRFTITLKPNLNILNLDELTKQQELNIVKKLDTQHHVAFQTFMKYFNGKSEYFTFWQYIRTIYDRTVYGREGSMISRSEFMKLGYDGIFSKDKIHSLEPQIIVFDENNLNIIKVDQRDEIYSPIPYMKKIKDEFIYEILKQEESELKWNEEISDYKGNPSYYISVKNGEKTFGVKIHYTGNDDGTIYVNISPYKNRGYSMGAIINIYEPDWEDFGKELTIELLKAIDDIE